MCYSFADEDEEDKKTPSGKRTNTPGKGDPCVDLKTCAAIFKRHRCPGCPLADVGANDEEDLTAYGLTEEEKKERREAAHAAHLRTLDAKQKLKTWDHVQGEKDDQNDRYAG